MPNPELTIEDMAKKITLVIVVSLSVFAAGVALGEGRAVYDVRVDGLACPFCVHGLEKQLLAIEGVETVETDIKTGIVTVAMYEGVLLAEDAARMRFRRALRKLEAKVSCLEKNDIWTFLGTTAG